MSCGTRRPSRKLADANFRSSDVRGVPSSLPVRTHVPYPTQTHTHSHKLPSHLTSARASALCAWVGRVAGYHGLRSQRRYSAFYECSNGKGRRGADSFMTACVDDTKCNIWFRALKYNQQVQSARSDRATGPPVRVLSSGWRKRRRRGYVWIIALSMPKFASRQDRPDTAVSSPNCSYTSRHGNTAPACDNRQCTHIAS